MPLQVGFYLESVLELRMQARRSWEDEWVGRKQAGRTQLGLDLAGGGAVCILVGDQKIARWGEVRPRRSFNGSNRSRLDDHGASIGRLGGGVFDAVLRHAGSTPGRRPSAA